jgi:hypothetical protein
MGRALMRAHPQADAIFLPSPHWPVIEAIEALEQEFGKNTGNFQPKIYSL